jgi:hypothetical protein
MSAADFPPRCKDKKNLANDVHCELYFLQNYAKFLRTQPILVSFSINFVCFMLLYTPFNSKTSVKKKNWKKQLTAFLPIIYSYFPITCRLQNPTRFA